MFNDRRENRMSRTAIHPEERHVKTLPRRLALMLSALALAAGAASLPARADGGGASELSALSMLPVALSVAAPLALLSAGTALAVVAAQATSDGTLWVLERASDDARASVLVSGQLAGGLSLAAGSAVLVTAMSTGWVLSAAGRAIAFIPNELGKALLYNERITR